MAFAQQENPVVEKISRIRVFDGVYGDEYEIQRRYDERGRNISEHVSNQAYDFDLSKAGVLKLRHGCRKISNTGKTATIEGLFFFSVAGNLAYGMLYNEALDLITLPAIVGYRDDPIEFTPAGTKVTLTSFRPNADPSYPV